MQYFIQGLNIYNYYGAIHLQCLVFVSVVDPDQSFECIG